MLVIALGPQMLLMSVLCLMVKSMVSTKKLLQITVVIVSVSIMNSLLPKRYKIYYGA